MTKVSNVSKTDQLSYDRIKSVCGFGSVKLAYSARLTACHTPVTCLHFSTSQIGKRLVAAGLTNDAETRRGYREVLFAHPQIGEWLAGAILFEETLGQANADGIPFPQV